MPKLNRVRDDALLDYLHPFLQVRFGVLARTPDFADVDFANATHLIEVKGRTGRAEQFESFRLSRRKFNAMRRATLERAKSDGWMMVTPTPWIVWAFSDEVIYADLLAIAPNGFEIPWIVGGRIDRIGTAREGAHDVELVWDVPRSLCRVLVQWPTWNPVKALAA